MLQFAAQNPSKLLPLGTWLPFHGRCLLGDLDIDEIQAHVDQLLVRKRVNGAFDVVFQEQRNVGFFESQKVIDQKVVKLALAVQVVSVQKEGFLGGLIRFVDQIFGPELRHEFAELEPELRRKSRNVFVADISEDAQEILGQLVHVLRFADLVYRLQIKHRFEVRPGLLLEQSLNDEFNLAELVRARWRLFLSAPVFREKSCKNNLTDLEGITEMRALVKVFSQFYQFSQENISLVNRSVAKDLLSNVPR